VIGTIIKREWTPFWNEALAIALIFLPRILAAFIIFRKSKREEAEYEKALAAGSSAGQ